MEMGRFTLRIKSTEDVILTRRGLLSKIFEQVCSIYDIAFDSNYWMRGRTTGSDDHELKFKDMIEGPQYLRKLEETWWTDFSMTQWCCHSWDRIMSCPRCRCRPWKDLKEDVSRDIFCHKVILPVLFSSLLSKNFLSMIGSSPKINDLVLMFFILQ